MLTNAIEVGVAIVGGGLTVQAVRQIGTKGWAASLQMAAIGFLFMGASAIGIVGFVVGLVLSPLAWLGVAMLGISGLLFAIGQKLEGRVGPQDVTEGGKPKKASIDPAPKRGKKESTGDPELDDIEALLRRHGID